MPLLLRVLLVAAGGALVGATLLAAIRTFVVPRSQNVWLTRWVFLGVRGIFDIRARQASTYAQRDAVMALYAPLSLLMLPVVWLAFVLLAYAAVYLGLGLDNAGDAVVLSGSSLFTLGSAPASGLLMSLVGFSEPGLGWDSCHCSSRTCQPSTPASPAAKRRSPSWRSVRARRLRQSRCSFDSTVWDGSKD